MRTTASAPGKLIVCGEHAVVYGYGAIAVPLPGIRAEAEVLDAPRGSGIELHAPDVGERWQLSAEQAHPLALLLRRTMTELGVGLLPDLQITLRSAIPIASGMGSGAALGAALVRAIGVHLGRALDPTMVSRLVFESERLFHGTPSGIDNAVVSYQQAIWFQRNEPPAPPTIEPITIGQPLTVVLGDTGMRAPTRLTVGRVREGWQREPARYEAWFKAIGALAVEVRALLAAGDRAALGPLLDHNQALLEQLGVSSPELERLVDAARSAGALGAKLSGGGGGGIMLALAEPDTAAGVAEALQQAGAARVVQTVID